MLGGAGVVCVIGGAGVVCVEEGVGVVVERGVGVVYRERYWYGVWWEVLVWCVARCVGVVCGERCWCGMWREMVCTRVVCEEVEYADVGGVFLYLGWCVCAVGKFLFTFDQT